MNLLNFDACIVGSGPAGVAAAMAQLAQGKKTLLLDVGTRPPAEVLALKSRWYQLDKKDWPKEEIKKIKEGVTTTTKGVGKKLHFGSDFAYQVPPAFPKIVSTHAECLPSFALGGLSTVWGAAALPYTKQDLMDWPLEVNELDEHYRAVLKVTRLVGEKDNLASKLPTYTENLSGFEISNQAKFIKKTLDQNVTGLRSTGIEFGVARVLGNRIPEHGKDCVRCGLCLYGCPKNVFFNSESILDDLIKNPLFTYEGNYVVDCFEEKADHVLVSASGLNGKPNAEFKASRIFLGGGVIPSAVLMLKSLNLKDTTLTLLDSQYFLQPVLIKGLNHNVMNEELMTSVQLFLELENQSIDERNVHLQVYTYSDMIYAALQSKLPFPLSWIPKFILSRLVGKLGVIQGYLHSNSSGKMAIQLNSESNTVTITGTSGPASVSKINSAMALLRKNFRKLGFFPLPGMLEVTAPGRGFHCGGTFPMSANPSGHETDKWGRAFGLKRTHLIDASVFPTVPSTTITLSTMANAHRIASKSYEN